MKYVSADQLDRWLSRLLSGELRSAYAMTKPQVASTDASNIQLATAREADCWRLICVAQRAFEYARKRAAERSTFGVSLSKNQSIREDIARCFSEVEMAR